MNEPVANKLDRVRPNLLARLHNYPPSDGIPDSLKNAATTYLLLNPDDGEVRQAYDNLLSSGNGQSEQT